MISAAVVENMVILKLKATSPFANQVYIFEEEPPGVHPNRMSARDASGESDKPPAMHQASSGSNPNCIHAPRSRYFGRRLTALNSVISSVVPIPIINIDMENKTNAVIIPTFIVTRLSANL